jgi:DME family drug/metabolite transporter
MRTGASAHTGKGLSPSSGNWALHPTPLLPFAAMSGGFTFPMMSAATGMLAYLGIVSIAVAYALFYFGLRTATGSMAVTLTLLEPLIAAVLAVVILGENVRSLVTGGGLLIWCCRSRRLASTTHRSVPTS